MPPAKRSSSGRSTSSSSSRSGAGARANNASRATGAKATQSAARSGAKSTGTSARKAAKRTTTQAKAGSTTTRKAASSGAAKTSRSARSTARSAATTAKTAGAAAAGGAKNARSSAKAAGTSTRRASGGGVMSVADQLAQGVVKPRELVMLTRSHIQEALDDAASRGRVTRKDANDLVSELVRRGRGGSNDLIKEIESVLGSATKRARSSDSVDRIVRGADRARRAAGVGPSFPILGYDDLNASQVRSRLKELKKPELRKVLSYERKHANRKSVVGAIEKSLA
jgi:polyhydroxyalkanoate synthesis regulator phasin